MMDAAPRPGYEALARSVERVIPKARFATDRPIFSSKPFTAKPQSTPSIWPRA